jgi:hypothetical protein
VPVVEVENVEPGRVDVGEASIFVRVFKATGDLAAGTGLRTGGGVSGILSAWGTGRRRFSTERADDAGSVRTLVFVIASKVGIGCGGEGGGECW